MRNDAGLLKVEKGEEVAKKERRTVEQGHYRARWRLGTRGSERIHGKGTRGTEEHGTEEAGR